MDASPGKEGLRPPASSPVNNDSTRRPALLPAFEPFSSSPPAMSNNIKRKFTVAREPSSTTGRPYPTPIPTSSTGILPSSPPRRPGLSRTLSTQSERAPLSDVPTVVIPANGDALLLGRSSNSTHFQLPYNRFISRVHVSIVYEAPDEANTSGRVKIECVGWNGCKVHCIGRVYELAKGDTYLSNQPGAEIIVDVQDTRVILAWPYSEHAGCASVQSVSTWAESASPSQQLLAHAAAAAAVVVDNTTFASSPPDLHPRSPVSPSPARRSVARTLFPTTTTTAATAAAAATTTTEPSNLNLVQVYEDAASDSADASLSSPCHDLSKSHVTEVTADNVKSNGVSFASTNDSNGFSDNENENEENDPIVHSFGPYGSNLLSRMNSFTTGSPQPRRRQPLQPTTTSPSPTRRLRNPSSSPQKMPSASRLPASKKHARESPIKNHVINQLAFSRVHAIPLSTILGNLPADLKSSPVVAVAGVAGVAGVAAAATTTGSTTTAAAATTDTTAATTADITAATATAAPTAEASSSDAVEISDGSLTSDQLKDILHSIPCVGEIGREGKDAAGKVLENEFYYVPEMDDNKMRRDAVVGGMGRTGLRAVRKSHKQYFWKRPRH